MSKNISEPFLTNLPPYNAGRSYRVGGRGERPRKWGLNILSLQNSKDKKGQIMWFWPRKNFKEDQKKISWNFRLKRDPLGELREAWDEAQANNWSVLVSLSYYRKKKYVNHISNTSSFTPKSGHFTIFWALLAIQ